MPAKARAPVVQLQFEAIPESRAISLAISLVSRRLERCFSFYSSITTDRKNFCSVITRRERISATSMQEGATGFWYFANSSSTTLVKCLESCRREEKRATDERRVHAVQIFPARLRSFGRAQPAGRDSISGGKQGGTVTLNSRTNNEDVSNDLSIVKTTSTFNSIFIKIVLYFSINF